MRALILALSMVLFSACLPPEETPAPDLAPVCGCLRPEVVAVVPSFLPRLPSPHSERIQVIGVGGALAWLSPPDVDFSSPTVKLVSLTRRGANNVLMEVVVDPSPPPAVNLLLWGRPAMIDALIFQ